MRKTVMAIVAMFTLATFSASAQQPLEYKVTVKGDVVKGASNDHFVTFSGPVHIPDVTLPAGTYIFSIVAPSVVQVTDVDRTKFYAMFFTAPAFPQEANDQYEMTLSWNGDLAPQRITKWFVPNKAVGFEFLYPKTELPTER